MVECCSSSGIARVLFILHFYSPDSKTVTLVTLNIRLILQTSELLKFYYFAKLLYSLIFVGKFTW